MDEVCSQKVVADNVCFSYRCLHVTHFRRKLHTTVSDQNTKQNHVGVENTDSMIFMALTNSFCCKKMVLVLWNFLRFSKLNFVLGILFCFEELIFVLVNWLGLTTFRPLQDHRPIQDYPDTDFNPKRATFRQNFLCIYQSFFSNLWLLHQRFFVFVNTRTHKIYFLLILWIGKPCER